MKKRRTMYDNSSLPVRRYRTARASLLAMLLFTLINIVMAAIGSYTYYVFTDYAAYLLAVIGRELYDMDGSTIYMVIGLVGAALLLIPYLLCWIFSKKRRGWLIAALVLFSIDTVLVIADALSGMDISYLMDIAVHVLLIVELALGIKAGKQALQEMQNPAPVAAENTEFYDASTGEQPDSKSLGMPQEERKHRVLLATEHCGDTIEVRRSYGLTELVVNGRLYDRREGLREGAYMLTARVNGRLIEAKQQPSGMLTIEVDGVLVDEKLRLF